MPEIISTRPDFLSKLGAYNAIHGIMSTFSEMKKTARRIERAYDARPPAQELISADEFLRIHYSDKFADEAIACVMGEKDCRNCEERHPYHSDAPAYQASLQRRLNRALVSA